MIFVCHGGGAGNLVLQRLTLGELTCRDRLPRTELDGLVHFWFSGAQFGGAMLLVVLLGDSLVLHIRFPG
jgi:hypothetical protein